MSEEDPGLSAARATAAALGLTAGTALDQIRTTVAHALAVQIIPIDGHAGHGYWAATLNGDLLITGTDPNRQLHDLGHLIYRHQPTPATADSITPHLHGRATAAIPAAYTPAQEHEAEIMRIALSELIHA